jgi:hypothetical protein
LRFLEGSGGASTAPTGAPAVDPMIDGSSPTSRVGPTTTPSTPGDRGAAAFHLSEVVRPLALLLV